MADYSGELFDESPEQYAAWKESHSDKPVAYPKESSVTKSIKEGTLDTNNMNMDFSGIIDALNQSQMYSAQQANELFDKQSALVKEQVAQNNAFAEAQAQKQMDFQSGQAETQRQWNAEQAAIDRQFQQESADRAMAFSSAEAQANRDWQQYMSSTAHQREMADLQAAGLNPILAANNGASMGAGSVANSSAATGSRASSVSTPNGAKADGDQSGTMALVSVLGKMLDNSTEIQKMITSAETARATAEMYTGATKYAAELAAAANRYGSDVQYEIAEMNPYNIAGDLINDILGSSSEKAENVNKVVNSASQIAEKVKDTATAFMGKLLGTNKGSSKVSLKPGYNWKGTTISGGHGGSHSGGKF